MNKKLEEKIDSLKELSIEELCAKFDCKPEDICLGDYIARNTSDTVCPYKVILGFADFENSDVTSLGKLEIVYGRKLIDQGVVLTDIHHQAIYNGLNLRNSLITDLGNLQKVYGSFSVNKNITSLGNLNFLGSNLYLNLTNITSIDTDLKIDGTKVSSQGELGKYLSANWITPQMDRLFRGGSQPRRSFLDRLVYAFDLEHAKRTANFEHWYKEWYQLLKNGNNDTKWLKSLEENMAAAGVAIAAARREQIAKLNRFIETEPDDIFPNVLLELDGTIEK